MKKIFAFLAAAAMMSVMMTGCGNPKESDTTTTIDSSLAQTEENSAPEADINEENSTEEKSPSSEVTDNRTFIITLDAENAPITCENFEKLVSEGFYNGLTFHRVVDNFMAQGGDPAGNGTGGSDQNIKGEFSVNGVDNKLSHKRGVVSMARSMDYDSASSQFFICYTDDCVSLDGQYAAFGKVTEGMEVIDAFLSVPRSMGGDGAVSSPNSPIQIHEAVMIDPDENGNHRVQFTMEEFLK